jgi:hypothetical protein
MPTEITVNFLDVGQGDGTLIRTPDELILIDMGSKKNAEIAGGDAITYVTNVIAKVAGTGDPVLNRLLLTHGDGDHYNLIMPLIASVQSKTGKPLNIKEIAIGGGKNDYDKTFRDAVLTPAENAGILTTFANSYHDPMASDGTVSAKWPLASGTANLYLLSANYPYRDSGPKNPKSLVVMLAYATPHQNVILTGDAEEPTEDAILGYYATNLKFLKSFALKLGHHGSKNGTSVEWLETVQQAASFTSSDMKWAHPYCDTIARIAETIGPGAVLYKHQWLCGDGSGDSKEYRNWDDTNGFYTTMASMTDKPMEDPEDGKWYAPGLVQGVQYQLSLYSDGTMQLIDTLGHDSGVFNPDPGDFGAPAIGTEGFRPSPATLREPGPATRPAVSFDACRK